MKQINDILLIIFRSFAFALLMLVCLPVNAQRKHETKYDISYGAGLIQKDEKEFFVSRYDYSATLIFGLGDNTAARSDLGSIKAAEIGFGKYSIGLMNVWHGEFLSFSSPSEHSELYSLYGGLNKKNKYTALMLNAGIGYIETVKKGDFLYSSGLLGSSYNSDIRSSPAADIMAKVLLHIRGIGAGVAVHANFNAIESYAAAYFFVQAGWWFNYPKKEKTD